MSTTISPARLSAAMSEAMKLRAEIGDDDDRLLLDSIEGQTSVFDIIDRLAEQSIADKLLAERASERVKRIEARADRARSTIQRMMEALGVPKLERGLATMTVADGPRAVIITDQQALPDFYFRRSPDKVQLGKDLKAGKQIAGAELANGQPVLRILSR